MAMRQAHVDGEVSRLLPLAFLAPANGRSRAEQRHTLGFQQP